MLVIPCKSFWMKASVEGINVNEYVTEVIQVHGKLCVCVCLYVYIKPKMSLKVCYHSRVVFKCDLEKNDGPVPQHCESF